MRKTIKLGGHEYNISSSAYTQFKYKNDTGRKLMDDVNTIQEYRKKEDGILSVLDEFIEIILNITYVMIEEANPTQVNSFDDFLKSTDNLFEDTDWVNDVMECALAPISGGTKKNPQ